MSPSRIRWGIFWILIGLVFLANNLGWLSWWVWADLLHLWPVILIAVGLEMIVKKSKIQWLGYLSTLLIIGAFAWAVGQNEGVHYDTFGTFSPGGSEVKCDYKDGASAAISVRFNDGRLRLDEGGDYLFRARARNSRDDVSLDSDCSGNHCDIELTPSKHRLRKVFRIAYDDNYWRCYVHKGVNSSFNLDLKDADLRFDGKQILVDTLRIDAQRSNLNIKLGESRRLVYLDLEGYRTDADLYLPDSVGLLVEGTDLSGSSSNRFDLIEQDGALTNDLYQHAPTNIHIKSDLRSGKLRLRRY